MQKHLFSIILALLISNLLLAQEPPFLKYMDNPWVDSLISNMSLEEKIAQSIWMAAWSNKDASHTYEISKLIEDSGIGGLIFFQGTGSREADLINHYQSISKVPLIMAMESPAFGVLVSASCSLLVTGSTTFLDFGSY